MPKTFTFILILFSVFTQAQTNNAANTKTGEISFQYNNQTYHAIVVNPATEKIQMHWLNPNKLPYKNLQAVKQQLETEGNTVLMLTNGGMYQQGNKPQGLFIGNGTQQYALDTATNKPGNFYLQPNGVFFINNTGAQIVTTANYISSKPAQVSYATQSGPMLVVNGQINTKFTPQSKNLNLRSGVGIMPNGYMVFIISQSNQTNFYDFAAIFKDRFGCNNALYLDGAISKMYLKNSRPTDLGGDYGVIISVTKK